MQKPEIESETSIDPVQRKTWQEFKDSKLLWWVNRSLHLFGWAIVLEIDGDRIDAYPARVTFRGFSENAETDGFVALTRYIHDNIDEILQEAEDDRE